MPPPHVQPFAYDKVPGPKGVGDLPRYLKELLGGFVVRFAYVVKLVWQTGHWILFLLSFIALFRGVAPVVGALLSQGILNHLQEVIRLGGLPAESFWTSPVFSLLVLLFVYRILTQIVTDLSRALNRIAGEKVARQVKQQIMEKSRELDVASFDNAAFYEKMENASREAGSRPLMIISETFTAISVGIELMGYLTILFAAPGLGWATIVIIAVSIPSAVINFVYRRKTFRYMRHHSKERRQMDYYSSLLVSKDLIKEVRMFDLADTFIGRFAEVFQIYYRGLRRLILHESGWHVAIGILSGVTNLVYYVLIALQVFTGQIMIGDYTLYTGAIASVTTCINSLISTSGTIYEGTLFIDNLITFMEEPRTIFPTVSPALQVAERTGHQLEFRHVSFRYPGTERDVLHDISFTLHPGETLALVGLNGAGKTTLIKLLTRLYDPSDGVILLDGRDIREYDLGSLYSAFGIIFQDFGKYAVNVEENIRFGDVHRPASFEEVRQAARQSAADDYISALPGGYDTPLTRMFEKDGIELSIGQWQKLAVARAFYADAEILILDEPTASLDAIAEQEIFNQFDRLRSERTTIFVSHRLSSATIADQILVLEHGRLIEQGSHAALMAAGGRYHELFATQASRYLAQEKL
ncbi:MAG: ABC transporter ATP-binding protein [Clostridia bacterium]|nr:ABC transporter ATP-binding protein [Clostridia bacterium]